MLVTVEKMLWDPPGIPELIEVAVLCVVAVGDGIIKGSYGSLLGSPSLGDELWDLETWELGTEGQAAVLTETGTGECIGDDQVATNCGNAKGD
jgi:hypothetical protein